MKKKLVGILICLLFFGVSFLPSITSIETNLLDTIIVPDDYPTIQKAIDNSRRGDTIFVRNGIYYERLSFIDKHNLIVCGESANDTIILRGFFVEESDEITIDSFFMEGTMLIHKSRNINIINNHIICNSRSFNPFRVSSTVFNINISNNFVFVEGKIDGLNLHCHNSEITSNTIIGDDDNETSWYGINLFGMNNLIQGNKISNFYGGMSFGFGNMKIIGFNRIIRNEIRDNDYFMTLYNFVGNRFYQNNFINNENNGQTVGVKNIRNSFMNTWDNNYWGENVESPYPIHQIVGDHLDRFSFPLVDFDWNPAQKPYDI